MSGGVIAMLVGFFVIVGGSMWALASSNPIPKPKAGAGRKGNRRRNRSGGSSSDVGDDDSDDSDWTDDDDDLPGSLLADQLSRAADRLTHAGRADDAGRAMGLASRVQGSHDPSRHLEGPDRDFLRTLHLTVPTAREPDHSTGSDMSSSTSDHGHGSHDHGSHGSSSSHYGGS